MIDVATSWLFEFRPYINTSLIVSNCSLNVPFVSTPPAVNTVWWISCAGADTCGAFCTIADILVINAFNKSLLGCWTCVVACLKLSTPLWTIWATGSSCGLLATAGWAVDAVLTDETVFPPVNSLYFFLAASISAAVGMYTLLLVPILPPLNDAAIAAFNAGFAEAGVAVAVGVLTSPNITSFAALIGILFCDI